MTERSIMSDDTPKIIVDDDWKSQAKAEKERLAKDAEEKKAAAGEGGGEGRLPEEPTFTDLVRMLATQALMYMGAFPDPQTGKAMVALDIAKLNIDLLGTLESKTTGNLDENEEATLKGTLRELRSHFVETTQLVQQAQADGRISASGEVMPGQPGPGGQPGQ